MKKSDHNLIVPIPGRSQHLIANPLFGTADLLDEQEAAEYENGEFQNPDKWKERGYLVDPEEEMAAYRNAYLSFIEEQAQDEIQIFFVPYYSCNFSCDYCYQAGSIGGDKPRRYVENGAEGTSSLTQPCAVMDAFFSYIDKAFQGRKKYLTLFGGEPLLPRSSAKEHVAYFLDSAKRRSLETAVVTNGYHVNAYIDLLKESRLREVQVTLDGMETAHNARRPLKNGEGTFSKIVDNIDLLLNSNIPVNLRMVLDKENIEQFPLLAHFAMDRGWARNPLFKTQLGRNYELHHCSKVPQSLYSRLDLYRDIAEYLKADPSILKFHAPSFHFAKHLKDQGELPPPNFDACPGAKTEWAFDYTGRIYSCTATVGKKDEALGTFYPEVSLNEEKVFEWQDRNVPAIKECATCNASLVCGGGCASLAKNKTGRLISPDCRPIAEIAALGISVYFPE
jgi:uncharacterized protein